MTHIQDTHSIHATNKKHRPRHQRLLKFASIAAVLVACVLVIAKAMAWKWTGSLSLQASLVDSLLDCGASIINLLVVHHALKPADDEHRFGHGKLEALGGLGQSAFIGASAIWLIFEAAHRLVHPAPLQETFWGSMVMIFAILLTAALVLFQRHVIRKTRSLAIAADSLHYQSDLYMNIGVLISLNLVSWTHFTSLDVVIGGGIALYVLHTSYAIAKQSVDVLMDRELSNDIQQRILDIARSHPDVISVHDLRTRSSGEKDFIQMHLDLLATLSLMDSHRISDEVRDKICEEFPHADVIIHQDPYPHSS